MKIPMEGPSHCTSTRDLPSEMSKTISTKYGNADNLLTRKKQIINLYENKSFSKTFS